MCAPPRHGYPIPGPSRGTARAGGLDCRVHSGFRSDACRAHARATATAGAGSSLRGPASSRTDRVSPCAPAAGGDPVSGARAVARLVWLSARRVRRGAPIFFRRLRRRRRAEARGACPHDAANRAHPVARLWAWARCRCAVSDIERQLPLCIGLCRARLPCKSQRTGCRYWLILFKSSPCCIAPKLKDTFSISF